MLGKKKMSKKEQVDRADKEIEIKSTKEEENIEILAKHEYLITILIALLCVGAGISLDNVYSKDPNIFVSKVIPFGLLEIGLAIIIALVLIRTLDGITRKREAKATQKTIEQINSNLFKAIFGRYIPDKLYIEVEKCLMRSNVIRRNYEVTYHLEHLGETSVGNGLANKGFKCENHVLCTVNSNYTIKNTTNASVNQKLKTSMELPPSKQLHDYVKVLRIEIDGKEVPTEDILKNMDSNGDQKIHKTVVTLKPREEIEVSTEMQIIKRCIDQEVWASRMPSEGIKLTIVSPADLEVRASASHYEDLKGPVVTKSHHKWHLPYGILPFQSLIFWWFPESINDTLTPENCNDGLEVAANTENGTTETQVNENTGAQMQAAETEQVDSESLTIEKNQPSDSATLEISSVDPDIETEVIDNKQINIEN